MTNDKVRPQCPTMRYIRNYNRQAKPIKWTYKNTRKRIRSDSVSNVTVH